jgi:hypothetical protein
MAKTPAQRAAKHGGNRAPAAPVRPSSGPAAKLWEAGIERRRAAERAPQREGNPLLIVVAAAGASVFLFWYFHLLTLQQMTQVANGMAMPDSLVGGFDLAYIRDLKHAMNADALGQLQFVHKTAGTLFPIVFALGAALTIGLHVARKRWRWALLAVPVLFALVQLGANIAIDSMLGAGVTVAAHVGWTSFLVIASWILLALSLLAAAGAVIAGRRRRGPAGPAPQQP